METSNNPPREDNEAFKEMISEEETHYVDPKITPTILSRILNILIKLGIFPIKIIRKRKASSFHVFSCKMFMVIFLNVGLNVLNMAVFSLLLDEKDWNRKQYNNLSQYSKDLGNSK